MRWVADFGRAAITGVMWLAVMLISIVVLVFITETTSLLGLMMGIAFLGVMILAAMALNIAIWRVALKWQGTGTRTRDESTAPAFDAVKAKRDTAHLLERLVDSMDDDELVELETLLLSREDENYQR